MAQYSPIESLINQAWENAFQPVKNNLPNILSQTDNSILSDVTNIDDSTGNINLCYTPVVPPQTPPSPMGHAKITLSGMTVSGLGNTTNGGTPLYQDNDTQVILPLSVSSFTVNGQFNIQQECCTNFFIAWCTSHSTYKDWGKFTLTVNNSQIQMTCSISPDPALIVQNVSLNIGSTSVQIHTEEPSWLSWLSELFGLNYGLGSGIQGCVNNILGSPPLINQLQTAMNNLLNSSSSPVSKITKKQLQTIAIGHGLPEESHPLGLLSITKDDNGHYVFNQLYTVHNPSKEPTVYESQIILIPEIDRSKYEVIINPQQLTNRRIEMVTITWTGEATQGLNQLPNDAVRAAARNAVQQWINQNHAHWQNNQNYPHNANIESYPCGWTVHYQNQNNQEHATVTQFREF